MNTLARLSLVFLLLSLSALAGEPKTVLLLTIGNSFSANATRYLKDLSKAGGHTLIHNSLVIGGSSFQVHADKTKAEGKARLYSGGRDLVANLTAGTTSPSSRPASRATTSAPTSRMRTFCGI
jgi:hypothetical protein